MSHATLTQRLAAVDHFTDEVLNAATVVLHHYTYGTPPHSAFPRTRTIATTVL